MIVLDTNIVSEMMKVAPDRTVTAWLNAQDSMMLYLTVVTIGEITYGLEALPDGRRRSSLETAFERLVANAFAGRILSLDEIAARTCGQLMAFRRARGQPLSLADGYVAAIAETQGFSLATRNVKDFEDCGLELINPFAI